MRASANRCCAAASSLSFIDSSWSCCCLSFSSSATRSFSSPISAALAAMSSSFCRNCCWSMLPSPPALVPDRVPVALPGADGGTISSRACCRRGAAVAGFGAVGFAAAVVSPASTLRVAVPAADGCLSVGAAAAASVDSGCATGRRACRHCCICSRTTSAASSALTPLRSSLPGTRNTAPRLMRLMLSPRKASGFARSRASMVWSRLKPSRPRLPAILDRVSPRFTGPYCAGAVATGAGAAATGDGAGSAAGCADGSGAIETVGGAGSACGCGAGTGVAGTGFGCGGTGSAGACVAGRCTTFGAATTGALIAGCSGALAVRGASTRAEYSRTSRPCPQSTSIRKFSTAWSTGATVVTRITGRPRASLPRLNCRLAATPVGGDRPTRRNVSGEASRACSASSSPGVVEMIGISASSGWLRRDLTSIWPKPNAHALPAASNSAEAIAIRNVLTTRTPAAFPCATLAALSLRWQRVRRSAPRSAPHPCGCCRTPPTGPARADATGLRGCGRRRRHRCPMHG